MFGFSVFLIRLAVVVILIFIAGESRANSVLPTPTEHLLMNR